MLLKLRQALREAMAHSSIRPNHRLWNELARAVYREQYSRNPVFRKWQNARGQRRTVPSYLPIVAFKESEVFSHRPLRSDSWFESSGTSHAGSSVVSRHRFQSLDLYRTSVLAGWQWFIEQECRRGGGFKGMDEKASFAGIMPSFRENPRSSLSCMVATLMEALGNGREFWCMKSGRWNWSGFSNHLQKAQKGELPCVLFGTAFGWVYFLDWCSRHGRKFRLPSERTLVLETGGYKGRSRELERRELYLQLSRCLGIGLDRIRSEYSMCELSSQAYSFPVKSGKGDMRILFQFPPWSRHRVVHPGSSRPVRRGERGVLEIQDLANFDSCAFLRTEDMVIEWKRGFEWVGRLPRAGLKGCSLAFEHGSET